MRLKNFDLKSRLDCNERRKQSVCKGHNRSGLLRRNCLKIDQQIKLFQNHPVYAHFTGNVTRLIRSIDKAPDLRGVVLG